MLRSGRPYIRPGCSCSSVSKTSPTLSTHCRRVATSCASASGTRSVFSSSGPSPPADGHVPIGSVAPADAGVAEPLVSPLAFFFLETFGPSFFCSLEYKARMFLSSASRASTYSWWPSLSFAIARSRALRALFVATTSRSSRCACLSAVAIGSSTGSVKFG